MKNMERKGNLSREAKQIVFNEMIWVKKESIGFSAMELQDFGKFLIGRAEHREGRMACSQISLNDPLEVRFFSDDPNEADDVYNVTADYENKSFKVVVVQGTPGRIDVLLKEFGFLLKQR